MEHNFMKGQASVEFLLTILIGILYITTIIIPNVDAASERVEGVSSLAKLTVSASKLADSIQYISLSGEGSRQTIQIVVPRNSTMDCVPLTQSVNITYDTGGLSFFEGGFSPENKCEVDDRGTGTTDDDSIICEKQLDTGVDFTCTNAPAALGNNSGIYIATVEKTGSPGVIDVDFVLISDRA